MIGIENESGLHRALKNMYAGAGGDTEVETGGFVCDCVNGSGDIIEIQTGSFAPLRGKLLQLCADRRVTIVYPVIEEKRIALYSGDGTLLRVRKSPKKCRKWDLFNALVYAPELPLLPNLSVEIAIVEALEERKADGKGSWRRGGVSITDRLLRERKRSIPLRQMEDYLQFVPFNPEEPFTAASLAAKAGITENLARKTIYVLQRINLVEQTGKSGRSKLFQIKTNGKRLKSKR
ncbi:MAG: hypothetical protein LBH50_00755 [Spirochaetaceae bacterium]|jgi:hypothetical protein|nr:hypothetical protein [Spirochaetaceae bacterium]